MLNRITIVGVGLIGGSLARALKRANYVAEVVGVSRHPSQLERARELGVIDRAECDIGRAVVGADMVVIAVPLGAVESVLAAMKSTLEASTVITDVGSAKGSVIAAAKQVFGTLPARFVPGHPIAGTERSGVEASFAELFQERRVILTPTDGTADDAVKRVCDMWAATGAVVEQMSASHHDEVLAATSHLPHLLAYALVDTLVSMNEGEEIFRFAAGGFRDFTRIASSDPVMWHDICLANDRALLTVLDRFIHHLSALREAVATGNSDKIHQTFAAAKSARDRFCMRGEAAE